MSIIGSASGWIGPVSEIAAVGRVGASGLDAPAPTPQPATPTPSAPALSTSSTLDAGPAPVDHERVNQIKRAIETNTYPIIPTKIGDAIIGAGVLLRMPK